MAFTGMVSPVMARLLNDYDKCFNQLRIGVALPDSEHTFEVSIETKAGQHLTLQVDTFDEVKQTLKEWKELYA